ncbi:MAG TPA: FadR/GntR family transcriptional regulator [Kineosporiaceae bacterium]
MIQADTMDGPSLRTARRSGLIDQVIEQLRGQIITGAWSIGTRIPTEAELAQLTGTSRNTVREAVQSLVHAGLLERRQGSGTYVLASSELAGAVSRRVAVAHAVHVLEVRRTLEVGAARLAAVRRTDADVAQMRELLARRNRVLGSGRVDEALALDVELHRSISQAGHNPVLTDLYENFVAALQESVRANYFASGVMSPTKHADLVEAIAAGDAEGAVAAVTCYLDCLLEHAPPLPAGSEPES